MKKKLQIFGEKKSKIDEVIHQKPIITSLSSEKKFLQK